VFDITTSRIYLEKGHYDIVKNEEPYVQLRYNIVALMLLEKPFGISRSEGAKLLKMSKRQVYRILKRFRDEGIFGLRMKSRAPKKNPNISPEWVEYIAEDVRIKTGYSPQNIASLMSQAATVGGRRKKFAHSTIQRILQRKGIIEKKQKEERKFKSFDWKRKNNLIQADLMEFNNVPLLTMEDDHTRKGWARDLNDEETDTVTAGMSCLIPYAYNNLLTDNGPQFKATNPIMRSYTYQYVKKKHIHASIRHPETLGKLGAFQKGLRRFLSHRLGESRNRRKIRYEIETHTLFYNNLKYHSVIKGYPEEKYSGAKEKNAFIRLIKRLKLFETLSPLLCG